MNIEQATSAQREAIETDHPRVLLAAGAGAGKTSTIVTRVNRLVFDKGVPAKSILSLSFTNTAAQELMRRFENGPHKLLAQHTEDGATTAIFASSPQFGFTGTLHSFALRMLKEHGTPWGYGQRTAIIAPDAAEDLMAVKAKTLGCKTSVENLLKIKAAKGRPERGKRLTLEETVIATYLDELRDGKLVDYDVLLQEFADMLTSTDPRAMSAQQSIEGVYSHCFGDEVQDWTPLEWKIIRALPVANKFMVGDSDQNLYSWRGTSVREMVNESENPDVKLIRLEENFRSRAEICATAQRLIEKNVNRVPKQLVSTLGTGGMVSVLGEYENEGEEIAAVSREIKEYLKDLPNEPAVPAGEIAVIARTNAICDGFRRSLPSMGIPIVETKKVHLPSDWRFARSIVDLMIDPDNDALAYFHLVARAINAGRSPAVARELAQRMRREANAEGKTINAKWLLGMKPIKQPQSALAAMTGAGVSRESHAIAVDMFRDLPPGATIEDFALSLGQIQEYTKEEPGDGVHILTCHGAKGREFSVVFVVGVEDQAYPGQDEKEGPAGIESSRRCLFVAATRAKDALHVSSVKSRVTAWKQIQPRCPSRFLKEMGL